MITTKPWSQYTDEEKIWMKNVVVNAPASTPFSPSYAACYIGKTPSSLQYMRCNDSNGIVYSKVGGRVIYRKKHLDAYLDRCERSFTAHY